MNSEIAPYKFEDREIVAICEDKISRINRIIWEIECMWNGFEDAVRGQDYRVKNKKRLLVEDVIGIEFFKLTPLLPNLKSALSDYESYVLSRRTKRPKLDESYLMTLRVLQRYPSCVQCLVLKFLGLYDFFRKQFGKIVEHSFSSCDLLGDDSIPRQRSERLQAQLRSIQ